MKKIRKARVNRKTKETNIKVELNIDGRGKANIKSGIPFFDHMLQLFAKHGLFDLKLLAKGDLEVDQHHTVEDIGLVLGEAFYKALGNKAKIKRFACVVIPMDEAITRAAIDISGRSKLVFVGKIKKLTVNNFNSVLLKEFLEAFVSQAKITLHIEVLRGDNDHHKIESLFKALGVALDMALQIDKRKSGVPSTKGKL